MPTNNFKLLKNKSQWLRKEIFEMVIKVNQGHIASALSQSEILISLFYGKILKYKKKNPNFENRDRLIISKGHSAMGLYPILSDIGYFPKKELSLYQSIYETRDIEKRLAERIVVEAKEKYSSLNRGAI